MSGVDIGSTVTDSIKTPFKDSTLLMIGIVLALISVLQVIALAVIGVSSPFKVAGNPFVSMLTIFLVSLPFSLITIFFAITAYFRAWHGNSISLAQAIASAAGRYLSALATSILFLIVSVVPLAIILILVLATNSHSAVALLFELLSAIYTFYMIVRLSIGLSYSIIGNKDPISSLKSSWHSTSGSFWSILAAFILIGLILFVAILIPVLISGISVLFAAPEVQSVVPNLVADIVSGFFSICGYVASVSIYAQLVAGNKGLTINAGKAQ
jgi:hypothetical protein